MVLKKERKKKLVIKYWNSMNMKILTKRTTNGWKVLMKIVYRTPVMKNGFQRHNLIFKFT